MGAWSVAIIDSGVTNEAEATYGANLYEYDYYYGNAETDGGRTTSHGSNVAASIELTNSELERLDMQISNNAQTYLSQSAIFNALTDVGNLTNQGWSVGAINMSFGSTSSAWTEYYQSQINVLANAGVFTVAAAGNGGASTGLENPIYPAGLPNVISVGSHDGSGNPSWFSQNSDTGVDILADGENFPGNGNFGTSYASPQVAATVATMQALVESSTDDRLDFSQVVDALQQGGAGPQSAPDPADNTTTYFLHDHAGSVSYVLSNYVDTAFSGLEYIASYSDIESIYGRDASGARDHFVDTGVWEGRTVDFDGLEYIASYSDLRSVFGTDRVGATGHYLDSGRAEGRTVTFDADEYMTANPDIAAAVNGNHDQATLHYITAGAAEGRSTTGPAPVTASPSQAAVSESGADLPQSTATTGVVGIGQSVTGTIGYWGDRDWFASDLTAGETVVIQARGASSGGGTLYDPELIVRDGNGSLLAYNFDSGVGWDAYLAYTPAYTGTHYLSVDGYWYYTGTYTLEVDRSSLSSLSDLAAGFDETDRIAPASDNVEVALLAGSTPSSDPFGLI